MSFAGRYQQSTIDRMEEVRRSTAFVLAHSSLVRVDQTALAQLATDLKTKGAQPVSWSNCPFHYTGPRKLDFIFAVDALNFCFWPNPGFEYDTLTIGLKEWLERDPDALSPARLANISREDVAQQVFRGVDICLLDERTRLLRELGSCVLRSYSTYEALVLAADHSAARLVSLVTALLPGFRDTAIFLGHQVFFYKRAQILVGDIWGAHSGLGLGTFPDISALTMFADYRVPQILRHYGVLVYSDSLSRLVDNREEIPWGSPHEVEIRAATVQACERLKELTGLPTAVETDWLLWQMGEQTKDAISPHHRTLSIFY